MRIFRATGQFTSWVEFMERVDGVGPKKVAKLRDAGFVACASLQGLLQDLTQLNTQVR